MIDEKSAEYYGRVEGEFGEKLRGGIRTLNGQPAFAFNERKDCIFLNDKKLCEIYRNLGPEALCETCRSYPRMMYDAGDITFCYLTNSCPEVNRMIMQKKESVKTLFDDSDEAEDSDIPDFERQQFDHATRALLTSMHILENRDIRLRDRMILLLLFINRFQEIIMADGNPTDIIGIFSAPEVYTMFLENNPVKESDVVVKIHVFMHIFSSILTGSYDHQMWARTVKLADRISDGRIKDIDKLRDAFSRINSESIEHELEQLMIYRFFAVFMQGFANNDYYEKLVYEYAMYVGLITYIALNEFEYGCECSQEDRILFYSLCSRIDHTYTQKQKLIEELKKDGMYKLDEVIFLTSRIFNPQRVGTQKLECRKY